MQGAYELSLTSFSDKTSYAACQLHNLNLANLPFDTSMNFSCALSSGLTSGWYFLDSFCL